MITITKKEFEQLAAFIKSNYGIHLKAEKESLVMGRLQNVLIQNGFKSFTEYYDYIVSDKTQTAVTVLLNKITTNHTFFMREADHFNYFSTTVLPLLSNKITNHDLRIWCAGCSSGEEPYTLAMLIDEFFGKEKLYWDTKILATDISSKVLEEATNGVYSNKDIETLPSKWKLNYIKRKNELESEFTAKIKDEVIFRKFNLMEPVFPFKKKFHVIFCRNVMIYFDDRTKRDLVRKFSDSLENGGYLFIGHSESLGRDETDLKYIMPAVYRKI
ncbi:MAG: cheR3 [Herbinix sp.]|jgi:chemotaxis protein methyltransferase CheR|nr:cheR3 [Herbinix sp.]